MDLFIEENHRGKDYLKKLMTYITEFDKLKSVKVRRPATSDAHELYKKFGFNALAKPENLIN